ncbi:hypothetical protein [Ensifer sp. Root278]|uniref:hypothetical protein n=1 Tax=Ensifer sp. Root278 TaxID=1736509 RepID=UPI001FCD5E47|nr:hypothetical protein [Ensifer sp. Root278]
MFKAHLRPMMKATDILQRNGNPTRRDAATHLFTVGQAVRLKGEHRGSALPADIYHFTFMRPPSDGSTQYRIRNDDERHDRATTKGRLEPVCMASADDGATLTERMFGHGQRTETQQSRNQKAEAEKGFAQS